MKILSAVFICSILLLSCANPKIISVLQEESSKQMQCEPGHIEIIQHQKLDNGDMTWTALCNGDTYQCRDEEGAVSCSRMSSQFPN